MPDIIQFNPPPELRDSTVIAAFTSMRRGGRLPARTLSHLIEAWNTERLARTDLDDIYDLTVHRPEGHYEGERRVIEWPHIHFFHAQPAGATGDLLLLVGAEPNFRWRAVAEMLIEHLNALSARTLIFLRAFPGDVPHTRSAPILLNGSDIELASTFGATPSGTKYEGVTDFGSVLGARAEDAGLNVVDLTVQQPYYFPRMPHMEASIAFIRALDRAFGTATPVDSLVATAAEQRAVLDAEMARSDELKSVVFELERRYDSTYGSMQDSIPMMELPSAGEVINQIEDLFRQGKQNPD